MSGIAAELQQESEWICVDILWMSVNKKWFTSDVIDFKWNGADLYNVRDIFWLQALGKQAVRFELQNALTELISSAVGGSAGQDMAGGLLHNYLLDGLRQCHSFAWTDKEPLK